MQGLVGHYVDLCREAHITPVHRSAVAGQLKRLVDREGVSTETASAALERMVTHRKGADALPGLVNDVEAGVSSNGQRPEYDRTAASYEAIKGSWAREPDEL